MNQFKISFSKLDHNDVFKLLKRSSPQFNPPLNDSIDIEQYSEKLSKFASFITCSVNNCIEAFIAFYPNQDTSIAYVSLVWVDEHHRGKGIAKAMFEEFFKKCLSIGLRYSDLEVLKNNHEAANLYATLGYKIMADHQCKNLLRITL